MPSVLRYERKNSILYEVINSGRILNWKEFFKLLSLKFLLRYGPDAAKITESSLYSVGNAATTVYNFRNMKIIRTVAKETAKETLSSSSKINKTSVPQTSQNNDKENSKKANVTI